METMEQNTTTEDVERMLAPPYAGLRGRDLVSSVMHSGPECVPHLGGMQVRYLSAVCVRNGIQWPQDFFESDIDALMGWD